MTEELAGGGNETVQVNIRTRSGKEKELTAGVIRGLAVFEGDIILGRTDALGERDGGDGERGIAVSDVARLWPGGRVAYEIDPDLPAPERVRAAIDHWEERTPIRFKERTPRNESRIDDWIRFADEGGCASYIGRVGGMQVITLGGGCSVGNAIHEIGHALGLWHEQSREDRDNYVRILVQNIQPDRLFNFNQEIDEADDVGSYDFGSIMHYGPMAFSANGQPTIEPRADLPPGTVFGQREGLSDGDVATIRSMYGRRKRRT